MTGGQTSHLTVTYKETGVEIARIYAISEDTLCELGRSIRRPTGKALRTWLETKGCRLDSPEGPAFVRRFADGSTIEEYYQGGRLHRENGPAYIRHCVDGRTIEKYYRNGRLHCEDSAA
jgi:hypothetical protein